MGDGRPGGSGDVLEREIAGFDACLRFGVFVQSSYHHFGVGLGF